VKQITKCLWLLLLCLICARTLASEIVENLGYSGSKITISYSLWGGADEVKNGRVQCQEFVKLHPNIRISINVYPWGQYWAKLQTEMASGLAPDVMKFYSGNFGIWASRGALLPLDKLAEINHLDISHYVHVAVANCTWNNKIYSLPTDIPVWAVVYSKDALEQSGIPKSDWPRSSQSMAWDNFQRLARRLTLRNADGSFIQYGMSAGQNWNGVMLGMDGGTLVDKQVDPKRATVLNNQRLKSALVKLFESEYGDRTTIGQTALSTGAFTSDTDTLLLSKKFAMGTAGPWALEELKKGNVNFGVTPMPHGAVRHNLINVNSVGIYAFTKHPQQAFEFIQFMTSLQAEKEIGLELTGVPTLKAAQYYFIHNKYGISDCQAFLNDLQVSVPAITSSSSGVTRSRDLWVDGIDADLDNLYDSRLNGLANKSGTISATEYASFAAKMNTNVVQMVNSRLPLLQTSIQQAIDQDHEEAPSFFVKVWLPAIAIVLLVILGGVYIRSISKVRSRSILMAHGIDRGQSTGLIFISPWLFGFVFFTLGPMLAALYLSFTHWNMIRVPEWIGFSHYVRLPSDPNFIVGLKNTFLYALLVIPISLVGGLFTAGLLVNKVKFANVFKAIIYFPALFTGAASAVLWVNMLNKDHGVLNTILGWIHIAPVNWIDESHALYAVVMMNIFWVGSAMIIYFAGMKQIPESLYEAADLDGAGTTLKFLKITIPLLSPVILFMVVITTIGAFQVFTPALFFARSSSTIGEPGNSLRFYAVNIYDTAFNNLQMGTACTYAIILFLIIFAITFIELRISKSLVHEG